VAVWKFWASEWNGQPWRTRKSNAANNWKNEAYMAHEDGMTWQEIDAAIGTDFPPRRPSGNTNRF